MNCTGRFYRTTISLLALIGYAGVAAGQHSDIEVVIENGALAIESGEAGLLFEAEFAQPPDPFAYFGEAGFVIDDGLATPGYEVGFEVLSSLFYSDGTAIVHSNDQIEISLGPASAIVDSTTGMADGFIFGTVDDEGGLHQDLEFALQTSDGGGSHMPGGASGVYGLHLKLTSPQFLSSEPFLIAFNNGLSEDLFETIAFELAEVAGVPVPEPASILILLIGLPLISCFTKLNCNTDQGSSRNA